jgi:hypothetical protein
MTGIVRCKRLWFGLILSLSSAGRCVFHEVVDISIVDVHEELEQRCCSIGYQFCGRRQFKQPQRQLQCQLLGEDVQIIGHNKSNHSADQVSGEQV